MAKLRSCEPSNNFGRNVENSRLRDLGDTAQLKSEKKPRMNIASRGVGRNYERKTIGESINRTCRFVIPVRIRRLLRWSRFSRGATRNANKRILWSLSRLMLVTEQRRDTGVDFEISRGERKKAADQGRRSARDGRTKRRKRAKRRAEHPWRPSSAATVC